MCNHTYVVALLAASPHYEVCIAIYNHYKNIIKLKTFASIYLSAASAAAEIEETTPPLEERSNAAFCLIIVVAPFDICGRNVHSPYLRNQR